MSVLLAHGGAVPEAAAFDTWLCTTGTDEERTGRLDPARKRPDVADRLEDAFMAARDIWVALGRRMYAEPTGKVGHTSVCASFGSDFGIMLAWVRIAEDLSAESGRHLIICDDPWLFRALGGLPGVVAVSSPPPLVGVEWKRHIRGFLSRVKNAVRLARTSLATRRFTAKVLDKPAAMVVFAHPLSTPEGHDAYFGDLMEQLPGLVRLLHTDCPAARAIELSAHERTASLHGFGSPLYALWRLPFVRWRPTLTGLPEPQRWLVRRAAAMENGGGGPAMNRWQMHCQARWLARAKPQGLKTVTWPWENFAWERALVRTARAMGIGTVGYLHTVIGPHQFNYAADASPDGTDSIPDRIAADGPAYTRDLLANGQPAARIIDAGAFRFTPDGTKRYAPDGPVFVPLSGNLRIAKLQIEAGRRVAAAGRTVIVKPHPMYPIDIPTTERLSATDTPFMRQTAISAVLFTTGASGLEALLAGVPCVRLRIDGLISINVFPQGIDCPTANLDSVAEVLERQAPPPIIEWHDIFSEPDLAIWRELLPC